MPANTDPERVNGASADEEALGRVGAPREAEATSSQFYFWTSEDRTIEKTQLVYAEGPAGSGPVRHYGLVTEVYRRSRRTDMLEEADRFDGRPEEEVNVDSRGVTYSKVRVLASSPNVLAPPREESHVWPAMEIDARIAYGVEEMTHPVSVGLVRNGGQAVAGPAYIDLDYLLGAKGGHLNVTGIAGVATKSSFLTILLHQVIRACTAYAEEHPEDPDKPRVRTVILNVKGFDLFWLDRWSSAFTEEDRAMWQEMGWDDPAPLAPVYSAPQRPDGDLAVPVGREDVQPYSWSLGDVVRDDLFAYLFSDAERTDDNFALLLADIERILAREWRNHDGAPSRELRPDAPAQTFQELFEWFEQGLTDHGDQSFQRLQAGQHHPGTLRRFYRRLRRIVYESAGIFRLRGADSHPLDIRRIDPGRPLVVDIQSLGDQHLQRFVVAALLKQAAEEQMGPRALRGMHYLFMLDELNRFAPKGQTDPITRLVETVAAELRSRGVILLGAQQQASLVSPRVVENAAIRVLGRTGGHELRHDVYSFVPTELRDYVEQLGGADKLLHQPSFREPMAVRVPRPPWAMRSREASAEPPAFLAAEGAQRVGTGPRTLTHRPYEEIP
jgi:DNA helicase HerA-like ATPase